MTRTDLYFLWSSLLSPGDVRGAYEGFSVAVSVLLNHNVKMGLHAHICDPERDAQITPPTACQYSAE